MAGKPRQNLVQRALRIGEGHAVDVATLSASKSGLVHYNIDTSSLPVPDRRLTCDAVGLVQGDFMMKLLFAQRDASSDGFLSLLTVQMTFDSVHNFLKTMVPLEDQLNLRGNDKFPKGSLSKIRGPVSQAAAVSASIILAGYTGNDGCMDFYYSSPFAVHSINFGNKLSVESVVRVSLPTPLLLAMSSGLRELAPNLPSFLKEAEND